MKVSVKSCVFQFLCGCFLQFGSLASAQDSQPPSSAPESASEPNSTDFDMKILDAPSSQKEEPSAAKNSVSSEPQNTSSILDSVRWGDTFISIGATKLSYTDSALKNIYGGLYGNFPTGPNFGAEMIIWRRLVGLGLRFEAAYFTDRGFPASKLSSYDRETSTGAIVPLKDEKTEFTVVPIDAGIWLRLPLWKDKPLFVAAGGGVSRILHTETRLDSSSSDSGSSGKPSVNQGVKTNNFYGAELGVRITGGGFGSEGLSADALNLRAIYLCGFYRASTGQNKSGMILSSTMLGVNFGFELF
jgi:hypothetical protein